MARIIKGDIIAGVLGERQALKGYVGAIPAHIAAGDILHVLNMGGVIGLCSSANADLGQPLRVRVLGVALIDGEPANIAQGAVPWQTSLARSAPLILISGTCMNAGKTTAACEIIRVLRGRGYRIAAAKLAGVATQRDLLNMQDHGAAAALSFSDAGLPSTTHTDNCIVPAAKGILAALTATAPDAILVEFGDGIMGHYGVDLLLKDREDRRAHARAYPVRQRPGRGLGRLAVPGRARPQGGLHLGPGHRQQRGCGLHPDAVRGAGGQWAARACAAGRHDRGQSVPGRRGGNGGRLMATPLRVAVLGASGYIGGEALRLLLGHPGVEVVAAVSPRNAGAPVAAVLPHLAKTTGLAFSADLPPAEARDLDAVFLALPHGEALARVPDLLAAGGAGGPHGEGPLLLDMSGDFRIKDAATFQQYYKLTRSAPELAHAAAYGLTEWNRPAIREASLIACPGCFPTGALLALTPLARAGLCTAR